MLLPTSGYRSSRRQARLFARAVARYGSPQAARRWVAPPGASAHQSGRAIDLYLGGRNDSAGVARLRELPAYRWLVANALRYGFYPYEREPWHWEYNPPQRPEPQQGELPAEELSWARSAIELARAMASGERDPDRLTNVVFFARHPERGGQKIQRGETAAAEEWIRIRDTIVRPGLQAVARSAGAPARGGATGPGSGAAVKVVPVRRSAESPASLEDGMAVHGLARFQPAGHPLDLVLRATAAAEGGFDTVNAYDRGILSWGIMQWTVHQGSLQRALGFIKQRLSERGQASLWAQLFPDLDVRPAAGEWQLLHRGTPVTGIPALRVLFRGKANRGEYDAATLRRWATIFARAGRHPVIQELQREYARREVDRVLDRDLGGGYGRVRTYVAGSPKATVLMFGMWTNNPTQSYRELRRAIDRVAKRYGTRDTRSWPPEARTVFADEFERVLRASRFDWWGDARARAAKPKPRRSRTQKLIDDYNKATQARP